MEILQENDYYPFGLRYPGEICRADTPPVNRYRYNGKELVEDLGLGWYDYGARWYDPAIGRWNAVDPLASSFPDNTPYHYVHNNPIILVDPTGMSASSPIFGTDGKFLGTDSRGFEGDIIIMNESEYETWATADAETGGDGVIDGDMTDLLVEAGVARTMDDYIANDFNGGNSSDIGFVSNVFTGLIDAAHEAGLIDYSSEKLSGGKFRVEMGAGSNAAHFYPNGEKDKITISVNSMSYDELVNKNQFSGTQSLHHLGNSGDAINILGVHEPLHRQYPGNANHPKIDPIVLGNRNRAAHLMSSEYRQKVQQRLKQ